MLLQAAGCRLFDLKLLIIECGYVCAKNWKNELLDKGITQKVVSDRARESRD